jgi:heme oxygenase
LNIADDVYRNQYEDADLTEEQRAKIIKIAEKIDNNMVKDIISKINIGEIHGLNYKAAIAKLERLAGGK